MKDIINLKNKMRIILDFPKDGISYKDITPILQDKDTLNEMVEVLEDSVKDLEFDYILGIEARGFLLGMVLAYSLNKGFIMARKPGKLPGETVQMSYDLEYGKATMEIDKDSFEKGAKILVVDDLLATGGTANAVCSLVEKVGGEVAATLFLTELTGIGGRKVIEESGHNVISVLQWEF